MRRVRERALPAFAARAGNGCDPLGRVSADLPGPEELAERRERVAKRATRSRALKADERLAIVLQAEGYSYAEICERCGWTYTKVNRCLAEGRARLRAGAHLGCADALPYGTPLARLERGSPADQVDWIRVAAEASEPISSPQLIRDESRSGHAASRRMSLIGAARPRHAASSPRPSVAGRESPARIASSWDRSDGRTLAVRPATVQSGAGSAGSGVVLG